MSVSMVTPWAERGEVIGQELVWSSRAVESEGASVHHLKMILYIALQKYSHSFVV